MPRRRAKNRCIGHACHVWAEEFLALVQQSLKSIPQAARAVGISPQAAYQHRDNCPQFRRALDRAIALKEDRLSIRPPQPEAAEQILAHLRYGLTAEKATALAGVSTTTTSAWRRKYEWYGAAWEMAVAEGLNKRKTVRGAPAKRADAGVRIRKD